MPQARRAGSSPSNPSAQKSSSAAAGKPAPARAAAAQAGAATPAASKPAAPKRASRTTAGKTAASRSSASKSAASKTTAGKAAASRSAAKPSASKSTAAKRPAAKAAAGKSAASKASSAKGSPRVTIRVNAENVQFDAIAERLRKLNEKIIDFGREAGENTLTSYEKALKAIASNVQQSPAKDELEWITHLAASQAKFVREITDSWTKAARERLKQG